MQLKDFLLTADADHAVALQQWLDYTPAPYLWRIEGAVRKTQVETSNIVNGTEDRLKALIANPDTPAQVKGVALKVLRALNKLYKPEFYINLADPEVSALFSAAHALGVLITDEVTRITAAALYVPEHPALNTTLHDVLLTRSAVPFADVTDVGGWVTITTNADVAKHSPRLLAQSPRTGVMQQINRFQTVEKAGIYECRVPREFAGWDLFVDDVYGVIA